MERIKDKTAPKYAGLPIETWTGTGVRLKFVLVDGLSAGEALSAKEAEVYALFRIEKRRAEWLAGRLAAKAVAGEGGEKPFSALEISSDLLGRPSCGGALLSISHSGGWAVAAAKPGSAFLGVDLEKVEERHPAWYTDYFHPTELPKPDPSEGTRLWAIKEAVMKALGLGLMADPMDIRTAGEVKFTGKTLERYREMGSPTFAIETKPFPEGFWTAVVAGTADAGASQKGKI
jgi:4'-phosphopantetheinyl transferase